MELTFSKSERNIIRSATSRDNTSKFVKFDDNQPKRRGRPSKYFYPLLQKEKELSTALHTALHQIVPNFRVNSKTKKQKTFYSPCLRLTVNPIEETTSYRFVFPLLFPFLLVCAFVIQYSC